MKPEVQAAFARIISKTEPHTSVDIATVRAALEIAPLTSEQIADAIETHFSITHEWPEDDEQVARAIERAHGIT